MIKIRRLCVIDNDLLSAIALFVLLMSSTTVFFAIKNMFVTMMVLLGLSMLIAIKNGVVSKANFHVTGVILILGIINFMANYHFYNPNKDVVIMLIKLFCCMIIASAMSPDRFIKLYVNIMKWMALISLICFAFTFIFRGIPLPLQVTEEIGELSYVYTPYYVLGCRGIQYRNCGMFWEPGGYQIYLNLALLFVICRTDLFNERKGEVLKLIIIFSVAVITTLSTTAFICLAVVLAIGVVNSGYDRQTKRNLILIIAVASIALLIVENSMGIIAQKLIDGQGSFATRNNDTKISFSLALTRPLTGYGLSNNYSSQFFEQNNVIRNSNGLGSFASAMGIPMTLAYLGWMVARFRTLLNTNIISSILILLLLLLFFMSESVMLVSMFIFLLYVPREIDYDCV